MRTDQSTHTSDATRETRGRGGPTEDVTQASNSNNTWEVTSRWKETARARAVWSTRTRRDQTAEGSRQREHVPRRILEKTTPQEHAVAVTTQEAPDGYREKTMRIEDVENHSLNWVSISSAGALDMTHRDFSAKTARDEVRHIARGSELDVVVGSDKDQNRGCKKRDKDHTEFLCELHEAQVARGRYFVHELTSEATSRMGCVMKIMATPGTRTAVADLCMFGLAAFDKGGPGFVNVSVRTITNARRVGARLQNKCTGTHRHARINANDTIEEGERTGGCSSN